MDPVLLRREDGGQERVPVDRQEVPESRKHGRPRRRGGNGCPCSRTGRPGMRRPWRLRRPGGHSRRGFESGPCALEGSPAQESRRPHLS